jgi:hypothetical protein
MRCRAIQATFVTFKVDSEREAAGDNSVVNARDRAIVRFKLSVRNGTRSIHIEAV